MRLSRKFVSEIQAIIEACYQGLMVTNTTFVSHQTWLFWESGPWVLKMIGSQDDIINGKLIKNFTTLLTASKQPDVQRSLDTSFVIWQFCKSPCSLITDDGWGAPLPGAVLSHCCGQPHYGPDLIIRERERGANIRWRENGPTAGGIQATQIMGHWRASQVTQAHIQWNIQEMIGNFLQRKWEAGEVWPGLCVLAPDIPMSLPISSDHSPISWLLIGQAPGLLDSDWSAVTSVTWAHFLAPLEPLIISCYTRPGSNPRLIPSLSHATKLFLLGIIEVSEEWDCKRVTRKTRPSY